MTTGHHPGGGKVSSQAPHAEVAARLGRAQQRYTAGRRTLVELLHTAGRPLEIIELAGGIDVLGLPGEHSERSTWEMVAAAEPRVVVCMPCGYDAERAAEEARAHVDSLRAVGAERVVAVDAAAYFSRPGPRLVDGLELLANILHPELVPEIEPPGPIIEIDV